MLSLCCSVVISWLLCCNLLAMRRAQSKETNIDDVLGGGGGSGTTPTPTAAPRLSQTGRQAGLFTVYSSCTIDNPTLLYAITYKAECQF